MLDSDAALIVRVVTEDDRAAFELLVRRHQSGVRAFLRRMLPRSRHQADDLAQETFLKLYRSLHTFRGQAKFRTWLYRIAYHALLDMHRRQAEEIPLDDLHHPVGDDSALAAGDALDMEAALRLLTDRQRAVFDLHYVRGLTHEEVAQALELPLGTVKSDLTRGLERLRGQLDPARR